MLTSLFDALPRTKGSKRFSGLQQVAALVVAFAFCEASAQTPPAPSVGASAAAGAAQTSDAIEAAEAMKRARRMAENPYRWIKIHGETKSKPEPVKAEAAKPRAPTEPATAEAPRPAPRPSVSTATTAPQEVVPPRATSAVENKVTAPVEAPTPAPVATPAVAVVPPASAPAPIQTAAASPTPDDTDDDLELKPISTPPEFPRELRNSVRTGRVTVAFTVQPNGAVGETSAESSTNRRLSRAALDAVKQWKFEPLTSAVTYKVEFDFKE